MRALSERKRKATKEEIQKIKAQIAMSLMKDSKKGKAENCMPSQDENQRNIYCASNFESDPEKNNECMKSAKNFCLVCCENEFGREFADLRQKCYDNCGVSDGNNGHWTWIPTINKA